MNGLTFAWDKARHLSPLLAGWVLLSLAAHGGVFFLFRGTYPPQASLPAPPPEITVLDARRPGHQALWRWIEAEDPAPAATGTEALADRLLELPYRPSFATIRTPPLTLAEAPPTGQFPPARDPLDIIRSVEPKPALPALAPAARASRVVFHPPLTPAATLELRGTSRTPLAPATFLLGVDTRGQVPVLVPQHGSGDAALDAQAAAALSALRFPPAEAPLRWTHATVEWGGAAYAGGPP
jgi:outer membrane biosynthesis protein TonB